MPIKDSLRRHLPNSILELYRRSRSRNGTHVDPVRSSVTREFLLPSREIDMLFPGARASEVAFPATEISRTRNMVLPLAELLTVGAICRQHRPKWIFEIGTFTGATSLLIAMNIGDEDRVFTLDLPPIETSSYSAGSAFAGTPYADRITQLYGDSGEFDFSPWYGKIDLVFIDANHTYPFVKADSDSAFKLLAPGGVIMWDDYVWMPEYPECAGVAAYLHDLSTHKTCFQLRDTRFAVHVGDAPNHYPAT